MANLSGPGALVKGFVTLSGVSGASVGGYYVYSNVNSSEKVKPGKSSTDTPTPSQPKLEVKELKIEKDFSVNLSECFDKETFFDGAVLDKVGINETSTIQEDSLKSGWEAPAADAKTEGCTVMNYFEETKESKKEWKFESKTLIKRDKVGIAIWLELNSLESNNQRYQVYLLEKNENNKWNVKFGVISDEDIGIKEIKSPDDSIELQYDSSKKAIDRKKGSEYSGKWITKTEGQEQKELLFGGIKNLKENFKGKYVYGTDKKISKEKDDASKERKTVLEKWFEPFKDAKGIWERKSNSN